MIVIPGEIDNAALYRILIGSVLPRPIAWVSTMSQKGVLNLAPFSFFTVASAVPPVLCFAPAFNKVQKMGDKEVPVPKDTLANIQETKEFVVNVVSRPLAEKMNQTSGAYPPEVSEFEMSGLTPAESLKVSPPRVAESLINMECKLYQIIQIGKGIMGGTLVLGEIVCIHMDDSVYKDGHIDVDILQPIGRMGGSLYATVKDRFEMPRPSV